MGPFLGGPVLSSMSSVFHSLRSLRLPPVARIMALWIQVGPTLLSQNFAVHFLLMGFSWILISVWEDLLSAQSHFLGIDLEGQFQRFRNLKFLVAKHLRRNVIMEHASLKVPWSQWWVEFETASFRVKSVFSCGPHG